MNERGLGRGLKALLSTYSKDGTDRYSDNSVQIEAIIPNPNQPRHSFSEAGMAELTQSIRENGVLQPLTVHDIGEGKYELIAGERRLRAAKAVGLETVPVYIIGVDTDVETLEYALVENVQREDLNPMEEAEAYALLSGKFNLTQEAIAKKVGKSRAAIANIIRLLKLPQKVKDALKNGEISSGHARAILAIENASQIENLYERIKREQLSVRQTEELVKKLSGSKLVVTKKKDVDNRTRIVNDFENQMRDILGTKVIINRNKSGKGKIAVEFYSDDDLQRILELITSLEN